MNNSITKNTLSVLLVLLLIMTCTFSSCFAANDSPQKGSDYKTKKITKRVGVYQLNKNGTAALKGVKKSKRNKIKLKTIFNSINYKGKKYNMYCVSAKTFDKCVKLKTLKIRWKTMKGKVFSKNAFKNLSSTQIGKIKVKVNKKMPKSQFKKLKKALMKAGIKKKNIKKVNL